MSYLLTQMFLYMLVTFILGLLLGWLLWRYGKPSTADFDRLESDRNALKRERDELTGKLSALQASANAAPKPATSSVKSAAVAATPAMATAASGSKSASKPKGLTAARDGKADDLKQISGVGPALEKLLHKLGYFHFDQIAGWTKAEEAWVDDNLEGFKGRVSRDKWIAQAKKLART